VKPSDAVKKGQPPFFEEVGGGSFCEKASLSLSQYSADIDILL